MNGARWIDVPNVEAFECGFLVNDSLERAFPGSAMVEAVDRDNGRILISTHHERCNIGYYHWGPCTHTEVLT